MLVQASFLIEKPPDQPRREPNEGEETRPATDRNRRPDEQRKRSGIHRMAHDSIRPRRDDRLPLDDLDRGSGVTILANDKVDKQESERDEEIPNKRDVRRDRRPHKATAQCRD